MTKLYAVVGTGGIVRRSKTSRHRNLMIYNTLAKAKGQARRDGDSVVEIEVDLSREPLFIRRKVVV